MKYFGGKNRLGKHITKIINNFIDEETTYIEPFVGSGGLFPTLKQPKNIIINDAHPYLMEMWKQLVETDWKPTDEWNPKDYDQYFLEGKPIHTSLKKFRDINLKNDTKWSNGFIGYFGFACCFSGDWFRGFCSDKSRYNYFNGGLNLLLKKTKFLKSISNIKIFNKDYNEIDYGKNNVIYLDPPYINTTKYSVDSINYIEFWNIVRNLSKTNWVFISEEQAPDDFIDVMNHTFTRGMRDSDNKQVIAKEKLFIHRDRVIEYNNIMNKKDILGGI